MSIGQFVTKWKTIKFTTANYERIDEFYLQEFVDDIADVFGIEAANVPPYLLGNTYVKDYLVRFKPAGGVEGFYYSLRAGRLAAPGVSLADWKEVAAPVKPTDLAQLLTLVQAQGIDGSQVVAGRTYLVDFGPDNLGNTRTITLRGISNRSFDTEGTLEVNGQRTPVMNVNVNTGTWQEKGVGGPSGAVFLRLRNGETLFYLGQRLRNKSKLGLRRFAQSALPAVLPAPVLDPDRPAGVVAPGTAFALHSSIGGPATGPAAIAEYTRQVADGDHFLLTGADLDQAAYPVYQNGSFYATTVTTSDRQKAAVRLPRVGAAWDAALAWPSTAAGIGVPVLLNVARVKWEQDMWAPGLTINIFGENLAHGNVEQGAGYVAIRQNGGPIRVYDTPAANPYRAPFQVPTSVVAGDLEYWYHNGHGGDYGWSAKRTVTVVAATDHVRLHDFGPVSQVALDPVDAALNVSRLRQAYQTIARLGGGTLSTPAGTFPLNDTIQPTSGVRWVCDAAATGGVTTLKATTWVGSGDLGMFGSNFWRLGVLDGIEFVNPDNVQLANAEALIVLNNVQQVQLRRVRARWSAPYSERQAGPVKEAVPVQPLRIATSQQVFLDEVTLTGSGTYFGHSWQFFLTNYRHYLTNNADHGLYGLHMREWSVLGGLFRDFDPSSPDGVDRGIRAIKEGGQGGTNQRRHLEGILGELLGIVYGGKNPAPDVNQFEMLLSEDNRAKFTDKVVRATATTVTVSKDLTGVATRDEQLVVIVAGRGLGQVRGIVSSTNDTITLDEPWRVVPDATSVLQTGNFSRDHSFYKLTFTGKPENATNPLYNHSSFLNLFGGCFGFLVDGCFGSYFRQGISVVATQHDPDMVDVSAFNVVRSCQFPDCRWGERIEAVPGNNGAWTMPFIGILATLFSRNTYARALVAELVYQLPRMAAGPVANIDLYIRERQVAVVAANDFSPSYYNDPLNPPVPPLAGTLAGIAQPATPAQLVLGAPGTVLAAAGDLGPLEPLPAGAVIDQSGVLRYAGTDPALLVWVEGGEETPVARTPDTTSAGGAAPASGYTDAQIDSLLATKQDVVTAGSGAVVKFDKDYDFPPLLSGTFTVDVAGARLGTVVFAELGAATSQPYLDPTKFELEGGSYQANKRLSYGFRVSAIGKIRYVITVLP
jgi:hypothetical protein